MIQIKQNPVDIKMVEQPQKIQQMATPKGVQMLTNGQQAKIICIEAIPWSLWWYYQV